MSTPGGVELDEVAARLDVLLKRAVLQNIHAINRLSLFNFGGSFLQVNEQQLRYVAQDVVSTQ